mgnify:CR=1 FL=1
MSDNSRPIVILEILKVSSEMEGIALDMGIKITTEHPFYKITLYSNFDDILQMLAKQL